MTSNDGKHVSIWLDSMSTGIYFFEGFASADGKVTTQECNYDDPIKGPSVWRSLTRIRDDNTLEYEMFITPKGGEEEKMMEMTVTRKEAVAPRLHRVNNERTRERKGRRECLSGRCNCSS